MVPPQQPVGDAAATPSSTVQEMLLTEARAEIGRLRTENFQCKRLADERLGALQRLSGERDQLLAQYHQHQSLLAACQAQIQQLQGVEVQLAELQHAQQTLQQEHELSLRARRILQEELVDERRQRKQVEESKAALESERSRHQRSKDDLALSLRVARKKAEEAEEEQLRAEQEAAQLREELRTLQSGAGGGGGGEQDVGEAGSSVGSNHFLHPHKTSLPGYEQVAVEEALRAAEYERCRAEALLSRLAAAEEEVASLGQELQAMEGLRTELLRAQHALRELQANRNELQQQDGSRPPDTSQPQPPPTQLQPSPPPPSPPHLQPEQQAQQGPATTQTPLPDHLALSQHGLQPSADRVLPPDTLAEVEALQSKVAKLKASRDKLLEQIDKQWEELDRMGMESKAASDELASTRRLAANWEAQAQDSLAHVDRLKEMLEEASTWGNGPGNPSQAESNPSNADKPQGVGNAAGASAVSEATLLQERARTAEMELTARACAAELLRAQHASMSMGKAMLPALSGIEYRLIGMLRTQQINQQ
ncbi:hypothetical protein DUNSADRAFT_3222 [Dunaliella salina]|uniref:Uncharacterized protein n=1 Tax=Dunaliella salina TaxID=3046 RepID=A0ABQ7GUE9_DUNSA|nr:hypothetical protein DUNSADRAFT_3222 [Dunaliella salina]|eukprot:KAF5838242.1 hypothetical protein DUNSADRAFT_3222 [Dunaliella salina]